MRLVLPYPPSSNRIWRNYHGHMVTSEEARAYKKEVWYLARQQGATVLYGQVVIKADIYRPRRIGDLSNRWKILEDALIGICYADDGQVVEILLRRHDDKKNPRVELDIQEAAVGC